LDSDLESRSPRYERSGSLESPSNGVIVNASVEAAILGERIAFFIVSRFGIKLIGRSPRAGQIGLRRGVGGTFEVVGAGFAWSGGMLDGSRDIGGIESTFDEVRGNRSDISESINESLRVSFGVVSGDMIVHSKYT
jgi:hypothetical protein